MSKLDDTLIKLSQYRNELTDDYIDKEEAKQQIKALMLELIGDNSSLDSNEVLKYKRELRQKVNEL